MMVITETEGRIINEQEQKQQQQAQKEKEEKEGNENKENIIKDEFWTFARLDAFFKNLIKYKYKRDWIGLARSIDADISPVDVYHYYLLLSEEASKLPTRTAGENYRESDSEISSSSSSDDDDSNKEHDDDKDSSEIEEADEEGEEKELEEKEVGDCSEDDDPETSYIPIYIRRRNKMFKNTSGLARMEFDQVLKEWIRRVVLKCIQVDRELKTRTNTDKKPVKRHLRLKVIETALKSVGSNT